MRRLSLGLMAAITLLTAVLTAPTAAAADGTFAVWNVTNGSRCEWAGNAPTLGSCTNKNYLLQNSGYPCSGCDWVRLYWGTNYTGAYYCVPPGQTLGQATSPNVRFNKGSGLSGYNQVIWSNAASAKWSGPC
jgi:hypothetical protein